MKSVLKAAAWLSVVPTVGSPTIGYTGAVTVEVVGDLKSTVVLFEDGATRLALVTLPCEVEYEEMRQAVEEAAREVLGLRADQLVTVSSHNHCVPVFVDHGTSSSTPAGPYRADGLNALGQAFIAELRQAMQGHSPGAGPSRH